MTADQQVWSVNIANGTLTPATGACTFSGPQLASMHANVFGMEVNNVYEQGTGPRVVFGYRKPGSRVPMIAALDGSDGVITGDLKFIVN